MGDRDGLNDGVSLRNLGWLCDEICACISSWLFCELNSFVSMMHSYDEIIMWVWAIKMARVAMRAWAIKLIGNITNTRVVHTIKVSYESFSWEKILSLCIVFVTENIKWLWMSMWRKNIKYMSRLRDGKY